MNKTCPECQTENLDTAKFCKKCGSPLSAVASTNPTSSNELSDIEKRVAEEKLYEQVAMELKNGIRKEGLYTKALADANGSVELANAIYIKYAVQSLQDELTLKAEQERILFEKQKILQEEQLREERRQEDELKEKEKEKGNAILKQQKDKIEENSFRTSLLIAMIILMVAGSIIVSFTGSWYKRVSIHSI